MKQLFFLSLLLTINCLTFSQIKVAADGKVRFGETNGAPASQIEVRKSNDDLEFRLYATSQNNAISWAMNSLYSYGYGINQYGIGAIFHNVNLSTPKMVVSYSNSWIGGRNYLYTSFGENRHNRIHQSNTPSFGGAAGYDFNPSKSHGLILENAHAEGSGIYMDSDYITIWTPADQGYMIRFFDEDGMVERAHITSSGDFASLSDERTKQDIEDLDSCLNCIRKLRGVSYQFRSQIGEEYYQATQSAEYSNGVWLSHNGDNKLKQDGKTKKVGFLAQELREILPEAVDSNETGTLFVNYSAVVPVLVEAVKELDYKVQRMRKLLRKEYGNRKQESREEESVFTNAQLFENRPNPFSEQTLIDCYIPEDATSAELMVLDLSGKLEFSEPINDFGFVSIHLNASQLDPGLHLYSLIVNGREVETKRMVITR